MAGDLIPHLPGMLEMLGNIGEWAGNTAGWAAGKGGEIVSTVLFKNFVDDLNEETRKAKADGRIKEDFDRTRHGQALFTETLNALWTVRDQERAKAIQQVFLGMAMNSAEEVLEQVEQLQIIRIAAEMSTWEVMLCNALEQYSKKMLDPYQMDRFNRADAASKDRIRTDANSRHPEFSMWLKTDFSKENDAIHGYLIDAWESLVRKRVLRAQSSGRSDNTGWSTTQKRGAFSEHGWKLAQYLYSAEVPTEVEVKEGPK
jgi:hypothetical protein